VRVLLHPQRSKARSIAAAAIGALALISSLLVAAPAQALSDTGTGGIFTPTTGRILDTSKGTGGFSTPMAAGTYRTIKVAGLAGVPDDGSVAAVSLNATVGSAPDSGTLFGRPDDGTARTTMLIYNDLSGQYTSNSAVVAVGADGTIQVMTETSARLILDVQGYYTASADGTAAGGFVPLAKRIVDTRSGLGAPKATLAPGASVDVQVGGANGVPASASGAVVSLIAINTTAADGNLTPYATGATKPSNSLHYAPSASTSIQAQVPLSATGKMTIANSSTTASLIVDLQGYFTASDQNGAVFTPASGRAYDTRATGKTALAEQETRSIQIAGTAGVPAMASGINAVVLTLIVAHGGGNGYAEAWADGTARPGTSVVNFNTDEIQTNTITVPLGANGKISLRNAAKATNYVIDVQGWYVNPVAPTVSCPYGDGTTTLAIPTADFNCTVKAPANSASGQQLTTTVDGVEGNSVAMSDAVATTQRVTVPARGGDHQILAQVLNNDGSVATSSTTTFHLGGDWATEPLTTLPADGAYASTSTWLSAESANDIFSDDTTVVYTVSASSDGKSNPILTSGPVVGGYSVPDGVLQDGQTYYWTAVVSGTSAGAPATVATPAHQFVATSAKVSNRCAAALQTKAGSLGVSLNRADYESTCAGDDSADPSASGDVDDEVGADMTDSSDSSATTTDAATLNGAVSRAASAPRAKFGSVNGHSRGYLWKEVMNVKWYYDGAHAWSKKAYRGVKGYQRCHADGSYNVGASVTKLACGNYSPAGKDILYETVEINYVFKGSPFSYVQSFHATITKTGKTSAGSGVGF
jgi:hypothetical protein